MIPVPENWIEAGVHVPLTKLTPTTLTVSVTAPRPTESGTAAMPYGPWLIPRQPEHVPAAVPGFVTITSRFVSDALVVTETVTVRWVGST